MFLNYFNTLWYNLLALLFCHANGSWRQLQDTFNFDSLKRKKKKTKTFSLQAIFSRQSAAFSFACERIKWMACKCNGGLVSMQIKSNQMTSKLSIKMFTFNDNVSHSNYFISHFRYIADKTAKRQLRICITFVGHNKFDFKKCYLFFVVFGDLF